MAQQSLPVDFPKRRRAAKPSRPRGRLYIAAIVFAMLAASALVIASQLSGAGTREAASATAQLTGATDSAAVFSGIPQRRAVLGSPQAPVTLVEYADLQCPYCGEFSRNALPSLVADYVRTGKVRLVFRGLAFVGPESEPALRGALAAGHQNRLWNFVHLLYENQGVENSGWITDGFISSVAGAVPGVDIARLVAVAQSNSVTDEIAAAQRHAASDGVNSTPSFRVGRTGGTLTALNVHSLDPAAFRPTLDQLLKR